jgi:hypothetical protein
VRLWLGLRVVPVGFSVAVLSGPLLWPGRVRVILTRLTPATPRAVAGPGLWPAAFPACSCRPLAPAPQGQPANRSRSAVTSALAGAEVSF